MTLDRAPQAEVLGKRVVVQHIPLGGLLEWDVSPSAPSTNAPAPFPSSAAPLMAATAEPWASGASYGTSMPPPTSFTAAPSRVPPTSFTTGFPHNPHSIGRRASPGGPLVHPRAPLGPTASSALRPTVRPGIVPGALTSPQPPSASHPQAPTEGDEEQASRNSEPSKA